MKEKKRLITKYPRTVAESELLTRKDLSTAEIIDMRDTDRQQELTRKNLNYDVSYCYAMDGISAYCTDNFDKAVITLLENNYYSICVTPEEWENYCLGEYAKDKTIKNRFYDNFKDIVKNPKTLVMVTDEGIFVGEPIRILVKRKDDTINAHGGNTKNLQTWDKTQNKYVPVPTSNPIDYIRIDFFRPLFKQVVEDQESYIRLPRHLQAIIDHTELYNPDLFKFDYYSKYDESKTLEISPQTVRKYFLYVTTKTNYEGKQMRINAIDFWKCVNARRIGYTKGVNAEGKSYEWAYETNWNENRQAFACLTRLHRHLVDEGKLQGIRFTTCGVYRNAETGNYEMSVYRKEPLIAAPPYEEDPPFDIDEEMQVIAGNNTTATPEEPAEKLTFDPNIPF